MEKVKYQKTKSHQQYKLADGTKVPGVTTVLNLQSKPALLAWAWQCGVDGIDFRKSKDQAADIGSIAHWLIECHLKGLEPDTYDFAPADLSKAENAVIKFLSWWDAGGYKLLESERQGVSEKYGYGGTLDIVAQDKTGAVCLVDLKTAKGIYEEYWQQVAAYGQIWNEIDTRPITKYIIVRIGKEESAGDFEAQERTDLAKQLRVFMAFLEAYKAIQACKGK